MPHSFVHLSQDQLMQLGVAAMQSNEDAKAVVFLTEAAGRADASAKVLFLLGSQYAHIGLHDAAADVLRSAVDADPAFELARFQLGLLLLSMGLADDALLALAPLADSDPEGPFPHWQAAISHLVRDAFAEALVDFRRGMDVASGLSNPALTRDIGMLVERVQELSEQAGSTSASPEPAGASGLPHLFLNAYTKGRPH